MAQGDAQRLLTRFCEPCTEARSLPSLRSIRELARAPLDRQVEYARWYFRKKKALGPKEVDIVLQHHEQPIEHGFRRATSRCATMGFESD